MEQTDNVVIDALPAKGMQLKAEHKAEWVRRFRGSGLSLRKFSAQYGLRVASLCSWSNREREAKLGCAAPAFVEVAVPALASERTHWVAELELGNGKALRISADVPEAMLEQLLRIC